MKKKRQIIKIQVPNTIGIIEVTWRIFAGLTFIIAPLLIKWSSVAEYNIQFVIIATGSILLGFRFLFDCEREYNNIKPNYDVYEVQDEE